MPDDEARAEEEPIAKEWLERYIESAVRRRVDDDEFLTLRRAAAALAIPPEAVAASEARLYRRYLLDSINSGNLPRASTEGLQLPAGETCYINVPATRMRRLKSGPDPVHGHFILTDKKLRFSSARGGAEMSLGKIVRVANFGPNNLLIEATSPTLAGYYYLPDAEWAATVIAAVLKANGGN